MTRCLSGKWKIPTGDTKYGRDVGANQVGRKSLDYRLVEDSTSTKDLVMEIQSGLCETLGDCEWYL